MNPTSANPLIINGIIAMWRGRSAVRIIGCLAVTAFFTTVLMLAQGCSGQKSQIAEEPPREELPGVGTLDDYLASEDQYSASVQLPEVGTLDQYLANQDQYSYVTYGPYGLFVLDPFLFPPYWYPVPIYYLRHHHHYPWPASPVAGTSLRLGSPSTVAARTALTAPAGVSPGIIFGTEPAGAMRGSVGFSYGHMGIGGHR